ncbi:MAG TPA: iron chelate uptake ABC transporter family permease subunit, partial [Minicystis sp.]|nr:iron chelate uptake ABC transporter family permease subunit [Minicystis sp.]
MSDAGRAGRLRRAAGPLHALTALLALVCALGVLFGTEPASLARALADPTSVDRTFLFVVRPPRVALAALAGGGLALVGAVFQALLRNPLAEPYVLGVSGGAA